MLFFLGSLLEASGNVRVISQGRNFQLSSILILPSVVPKVGDVFSNIVLPSESGRQPRAMVLLLIDLGVSLCPLNNLLRVCFPCL